MKLECKPRKVEKLATECKVVDFEVHKDEPLILIASSQNKLQSHYIKTSDVGTKKLLSIKTLETNWPPSFFSFSGKQNIVYSCQQNLIINNKRQIKHKDTISHLLVDQYQVALTTAEDIITVCSTQRAEVLAEMNYYSERISSIFWHNSLVIAGQERGSMNIWDINKQKVVHRNSINVLNIDFIDSYVDYLHTNVYYSLASVQRRIAFYDLRTYKPIKITNNISNGVKNVKHNPSGKIFMMNSQDIEIIDLYHSFDVLTKFAPTKKQNSEDIVGQHSKAGFQQRQLNDLLVEGRFLVAATSNGSIQIYNSDTFEFEYALRLSEFQGITKLQKLNYSIIGLQATGSLNIAQYN